MGKLWEEKAIANTYPSVYQTWDGGEFSVILNTKKYCSSELLTNAKTLRKKYSLQVYGYALSSFMLNLRRLEFTTYTRKQLKAFKKVNTIEDFVEMFLDVFFINSEMEYSLVKKAISPYLKEKVCQLIRLCELCLILI